LIRLPQVRWSLAVALVLLGTFFANVLVGHRPWSLSAQFALINGTESGLMVLAFRFVWPFPYPHISISQAAIMAATFRRRHPRSRSCRCCTGVA
jgi:integral membrane sensor domain MASE1